MSVCSLFQLPNVPAHLPYQFLSAAVQYGTTLAMGQPEPECRAAFDKMFQAISRSSGVRRESSFLHLLLAALVAAPEQFEQVAQEMERSFPERYRLVRCEDQSGFRVRVLDENQTGAPPTGSLLQFGSDALDRLDRAILEMCRRLSRDYLPCQQEKVFGDLIGYCEFFLPSFSMRETSANTILITPLAPRAHASRIFRELNPNRVNVGRALSLLSELPGASASESDLNQALRLFRASNPGEDARLVQIVWALRKLQMDDPEQPPKRRDTWPSCLVTTPILYSRGERIVFGGIPVQRALVRMPRGRRSGTTA